jgi:hypothetical protein
MEVEVTFLGHTPHFDKLSVNLEGRFDINSIYYNSIFFEVSHSFPTGGWSRKLSGKGGD